MRARLRAFLVSRRYPIAVIGGVAALAIVLLVVTDRVSASYAAQTRAELEARAQHGARELAAVASLGAAHEDPRVLNDALDDYVTSPNLKTIAIEAAGRTLVSHGDIASVRWVLAAGPNVLVRGPGYAGSWAPGPAGAKIAVVLSTAVLDELDALQWAVSLLLLAAAAIAAAGFVLVRRWHSPPIVRVREVDPEPQLEPAAPPPPPRDDRTLHEVLAHTSQGFVVVDVASQLILERAKTVEGWLGAPAPETTIATYLGGGDILVATDLTVGVSRLHDGAVPPAAAIADLPQRIQRDAQTFAVRYAPILRGARADRLLIILTDITEELARAEAAREAREQRDVAALADLLRSNRAEFDEFYAEAARLVATLEVPSDVDAEIGAIRALKDNCSYYGLDLFVELCTTIEATLGETSAPMNDVQRVAVADGWGRISTRLMRTSAS